MSSLSVTDAFGQVLPVADKSVRIVSLVPSLTELLIDLGLGSAVVGRTGFCIHPATAVRNIPKVGGTKDIKLDEILAREPTHVVMNIDENLREDAERLHQAGLTTVVTHPQTPQDNIELFQMLGQLFGARTASAHLVRELRQALRAAQDAKEARPQTTLRVLYLIWRDPWMTVSPPTYVAQMLSLGGLSVVEQKDAARYPCVDEEAWTLADRILLSSEPFPFREKHRQEVSNRFNVDVSKIAFVDGELLSWYGSRAINGVRYAATLTTLLSEQHD
jgi:ABC-type Fe3+-hydroxamate transport system substrate-binding protein